METVPEPGWEILLGAIAHMRGVVLILGATNSGKSTLVRYLAGKLLSMHIALCLVDADVGQSALGLPGTISARYFRNEAELADYRFDRMFFVGEVNPAKRIPLMVHGTKKMAGECGETAPVTIIDTTGLVSGRAGKALKLAKIKAVHPDLIIGLQRGDELEGILEAVEGMRVDRLAVSEKARKRSIPERTAYRRKKFADYFGGPGVSEFILREGDVRFLSRGEDRGLKDLHVQAGTLIGLNRRDETLALGLVVECEDDAVVFRSPIPALRKIDSVEFGSIRIG